MLYGLFSSYPSHSDPNSAIIITVYRLSDIASMTSLNSLTGIMVPPTANPNLSRIKSSLDMISSRSENTVLLGSPILRARNAQLLFFYLSSLFLKFHQLAFLIRVSNFSSIKYVYVKSSKSRLLNSFLVLYSYIVHIRRQTF